MKCLKCCLTIAVLCLSLGTAPGGDPSRADYRVVDTLEIDGVPSWFPVGFCLLTQGIDQYAAYDDEEQHRVACSSPQEVCASLGSTRSPA